MSTAPPVQEQIAYAAPAFALALVGLPIYTHVPKFYADEVGIPIGIIGSIILGVRVFDAISDPLVGLLSDTTRLRFGRRRPYILLGALPLAASIWLLLRPPELAQDGAVLWFSASIFAVFAFWTLVTVPYQALGPELSFDYHARTRLLGLRDAFLLIGMFVGLLSPSIVQALQSQADPRAALAQVAALYAPVLVLLCGWCVWATHEIAPRRPVARMRGWGEAAGAARDALAGLRRNRPFRVLLGAYSISALGSNLPPALMLFYVQYVLESSRVGLFLALYLGTGILLLPVWIAAARRLEKRRAWLLGMTLNTGAFAGVLFLGPGDELAYGLLVVLSGLGMGATIALPSSMQADVIDYDELRTGRRREGVYVGTWSVATKLTAAAGVGAALLALGWLGYEPDQPQTPAVLTGLKLLYAGVPCACNAAAIWLARSYPIDQPLHARIRAQIDAGRAGHYPDPLAEMAA